MRILILGSGGREHVLAKKISESPLCSALYIAPGNAGTAMCGENIAVSPLDFEGLKQVCIAHSIEMLVPGNEDPLVAGITDFFQNDASLKHI
ncbi:MAG: phosphoribosylamine--glycine ligase N-terminal domain-containing protein, partial [Bacteroidota bacterium]